MTGSAFNGAIISAGYTVNPSNWGAWASFKPLSVSNLIQLYCLDLHNAFLPHLNIFSQVPPVLRLHCRSLLVSLSIVASLSSYFSYSFYSVANFLFSVLLFFHTLCCSFLCPFLIFVFPCSFLSPAMTASSQYVTIPANNWFSGGPVTIEV